MTLPAALQAGSGGTSRAKSRRAKPETATNADRRLPFTLRVATAWTDLADLPKPEDGQLYYAQRAPLTGALASTSAGRDISFSDIEVR